MANIIRKQWKRRPLPSVQLDWTNPIWEKVGGVFVDCGGVIVDLVRNASPTQLPTYALVDTPVGPGLYFNNSGEVRFPQTSEFSHADALSTATTGEFTAYGRYFHVANGAAYNSLIRCNLSAAPYSQWGAEADASGNSLFAHVRSTSGARASTPSQGHGFAAGTEHSIALTSSVSSGGLTLYADAASLRTASVTSHYFDPTAGYFHIGPGVRGSLYIAAFWHRVITTDEMAALDDNPWFGLLPERRVFYADMGAGGGTTHTVTGSIGTAPGIQSSAALAFQHSTSITATPGLTATALLSLIHAGQIESALALSAESVFNGHTEHLVAGALSAGEVSLSASVSSTAVHTLTGLLSAGTLGVSASVLVGHPTSDPWMAQLADYPEGTAGWAVHTILTLLTGIHPNMDIRLALQTLLALGAGKATGGGSDRIVFRDLEDSRDAVSMYVDVSGNRTSTTVDLG